MQDRGSHSKLKGDILKCQQSFSDGPSHFLLDVLIMALKMSNKCKRCLKFQVVWLKKKLRPKPRKLKRKKQQIHSALVYFLPTICEKWNFGEIWIPWVGDEKLPIAMAKIIWSAYIAAGTQIWIYMYINSEKLSLWHHNRGKKVLGGSL